MKPDTLETAFSTYSIGRKIGQGGSGEVYRALNAHGEEVAIKILSPARATPEIRKRFQNEIIFCWTTRHPNVLRVLDHGVWRREGGSAPFYVMELFPSSLRGVLTGGLPPDDVLPVFLGVLNGVEAAHFSNVVHRDLKPENVFVDLTNKKIVVADFGIARFTQDELYTLVETKHDRRLANFLYAAPEQKVKGSSVDQRSDIFALGLMLNECYTGTVPAGSDYKRITAKAPAFAFLDEIVDKMICQNPNARYASIDAVKVDMATHERAAAARQKLSAVSSQVIARGDLDDPLVADPVRLIGFDWDGKTLTLELSQAVNAQWIHALKNMGGRTSVMNKGPEMFQFAGNEARIAAREEEVQRIIDYFKNWLPSAAQTYERKQRIAFEQRNAREEEKKKQDRKLAEARARVLGKTRI